MGCRVGMPTLKLAGCEVSTKRKANTRRIAKEALEERYSRDPDLDREKSVLNTYTGFCNGEELSKYWDDEAKKHSDARGRKLRKDAIIGFACIMKPDEEFMNTLTPEKQEEFIQDGVKVTCDILQEHGLQVDAVAIHRDERNLHAHFLGHDPGYTASKKINLRLYHALNSDYPERMRALGHDVETLECYDAEKAATLTDDELKAYKEEIKLKKKKNNRNSVQYKEDRVKEKVRDLNRRELCICARECGLNDRETDLDDRAAELYEDAAVIEEGAQALADLEKALAKKEAFLTDLETALNARKSDLDREAEEYAVNDLKLRKMADTLQKREISLEDLNEQLVVKSMALEDRETRLEFQETAMRNKLDAQLEEEREKNKEWLDKQVKEKNDALLAQSNKLNADIAREYEQLRFRENELREREKEIAVREQQIEEREQQIVKKEQEYKTLLELGRRTRDKEMIQRLNYKPETKRSTGYSFGL